MIRDASRKIRGRPKSSATAQNHPRRIEDDPRPLKTLRDG